MLPATNPAATPKASEADSAGPLVPVGSKAEVVEDVLLRDVEAMGAPMLEGIVKDKFHKTGDAAFTWQNQAVGLLSIGLWCSFPGQGWDKKACGTWRIASVHELRQQGRLRGRRLKVSARERRTGSDLCESADTRARYAAQALIGACGDWYRDTASDDPGASEAPSNGLSVPFTIGHSHGSPSWTLAPGVFLEQRPSSRRGGNGTVAAWAVSGISRARTSKARV